MKKTFTKILSVVLCAVMVLGAAPLSGLVGLDLPGLFDFKAEAATYSGTCGDNLTWSLDTDTGVLNITGTGAMTNYLANAPWDSYSGYIKTVNISSGVTTIGNYAFYWCDSLTSVTIPDSVTTIGNDTFYGCESLKSVTIPGSVKNIGEDAFGDCENLSNLKINNGVATIGAAAFRYCINLTNILIPASVTTIGDFAFGMCYSLTSIKVDTNNKYYSSDSYGVLFNKNKTTLIQYPIGNTRTSSTIPNSVTSIGYGAFAYCDSLTSVTIPDSVTTISEGSFCQCYNLTSITIPDSVKTISDDTFYGCESLTSVTIPDSVTTIGSQAFTKCYSLTSVTIPDSVTTIGDYAFLGCYSLTDVYYTGTESQWKKIAIGSYNDPLKNATIHYNSAGGNSESVKIMSYNVYSDNSGDYSYQKRVKCTADNILSNLPDSIGLQEMTIEYLSLLKSNADFSGRKVFDYYDYVIEYRGGTDKNEGCPIFYLKDKYELVKSNTLWLSETPDKQGSKHPEANYARIFTYAVLRNKETGYTYVHINTHLDHNGDAGLYSINLISDTIEQLFPDMPVVLTGDFNFNPDTYRYSFITDKTGVDLQDARTLAKSYGQVVDTFHGYGKDSSTLDYIFTNDYARESVRYYTVCNKQFDSSKIGSDIKYSSDHHPILAELVMKKTTALPKEINNTLTDSVTGIKLEYDVNDYNGNLSLNIKESFDDTGFEIIKNGFPTAIHSKLYDISLYSDGTSIQPHGKVTIKIPLPEGYNPNNTHVSYISEKTRLPEKINSKYVDGYLVFETDHFSYYAIVEQLDVELAIKQPNVTTINYGETLVLQVEDIELPEGWRVEWSIIGNAVTMSASDDGKECRVTSTASGNVTVRATVVDENGEPVLNAEGGEIFTDINIKSNANFWQKIVSFFKNLFRMNRIIY